jgi:hypothetical protein
MSITATNSKENPPRGLRRAAGRDFRLAQSNVLNTYFSVAAQA